MSVINPLKNASVPIHRSSFDMSMKRLFTAKVGELLPVYWQYMMPGDKYRIKADWFSRTTPVNTAAYTRIREYYDVFSVPLRLIHNQLNNSLMQMDYSTAAASSNANKVVLKQVPNTTYPVLSSLLNTMFSSGVKDAVNLSAVGTSQKLLNILDYGNIVLSTDSGAVSILDSYSKVRDKQSMYRAASGVGVVNILPLAAYQKIYYDFFSDSQWEDTHAYAYNYDYLGLGPTETLSAEHVMMRYANYPKDYLLGALPNSQYGDVASVSFDSGSEEASPLSIIRTAGSTGVNAGTTLSLEPSSLVGTSVGSSSPAVAVWSAETSNKFSLGVPISSLSSSLSALQLRAVEYLQRWKEVVQFAGKDFRSQLKAQFGVNAPEYMGYMCHYAGGWSSNIAINEVVNTNLDAADSQASIAGKGVGSNSTGFINVSCEEPSILMVIYHAVPVVDWSLTGVAPQLLHTSVEDFPQPAFDSLGMQPIPTAVLANGTDVSEYTNKTLGYGVRYWDFKSCIDRVSGAFQHSGSYQSWAAPLTLINLSTLLSDQGIFDYRSFKVRPQQLDSIFVAAADSTIDTDQLLCNVNFTAYKVSNLDRNGLPW